MREGNTGEAEAPATEIDWPSEELNTAWDLFLPRRHLSSLIDIYTDPTGQSHADQGEGGGKQNRVPCVAKDLNQDVRENALTSLRYLYTQRHDNNRYTKTRGQIRARYYALIPLILILLLGVVHFIPLEEAAGAKIWGSISRSTFYHLVLIAGALGGVLALILRFRGINRITEMRATVQMVVAQMCVGATTALVFVLVVQAGWISFSFLSPQWPVGTEPQGEVIIERVIIEMALIAFFVGLLEGIFLQLVERMEGILGDKARYQSPVKPRQK